MRQQDLQPETAAPFSGSSALGASPQLEGGDDERKKERKKKKKSKEKHRDKDDHESSLQNELKSGKIQTEYDIAAYNQR